MATYRIHFTHSDGTEDAIDISGDTVEDIRAKADAELARRNADPESAWSEQVAE